MPRGKKNIAVADNVLPAQVPEPEPEQEPEQVAVQDIQVFPKKTKGKKEKVQDAIANQNNNDIEVNKNWKKDFEKILEIKKPDDPLDCLVHIPDGKRTDSDKINIGTLLYRPARLVLLGSGGYVRNQELHAQKLDSDWGIGNELVEKQCWNADQYKTIEKVTHTQLAHKLKEEVGDCLVKVVFTKSPDAAEMSKLIRDGSKIIEEAPVSDAEKVKLFKKLYERSQNGELRIMRGYVMRGEDMHAEQSETGMLKFLDADLVAKGQFAERQINLRTIVSLTYKLVKYELK